jgi:hypothetical protein
MKHRRATFLLILALILPLPATAEAFDDMFGLMFRMMLTAMNVMSDMVDDNDWGGGTWPVSGWSSPWSAMSPGMGMWPGMTGMGMWPGMAGMGGWPGSGPGMSPWGGMPWGAGKLPWGSGWQGGPGNVPSPVNTVPAVSLLEGKWYGTTGDILEIRGERFRLKSGQYSVRGTLKIRNNLVWMYTPQTNSQTVYTFMRNQTELLLQESSGNILVFQKHPIAGFRNMSYFF